MLNRRAFLGAACSAAASPLVTPVVFAQAPGENRLVVIVLRGGLDGLGAVIPHGDPRLGELRPSLAGGEMADLDGFFGLGEAFAELMPLWRAGELGFVHAVSTPYRDKRSHFDGQDMLENGSGDPSGAMTPGRDGWLNRAISLIPGASAEYGLAVGQSRLLMMEGDQPVASWSPATELGYSEDARARLAMLYEGDPLFDAAYRGADAFAGMDMSARRENGEALAAFTAGQLKGAARIAAFSLGGWDTHRGQAGAIRGPARQLVAALGTLKAGLGADWGRTAVIAVTEFGRTARENGSRGTDHGTGGAMILAGGALRGGKVHGAWPGLADLYEDRDLMPTADLRAYCGQVLGALFGLPGDAMGRDVFPGVDLGEAMPIIA